MDSGADIPGDIRWLTYGQIAELRGISRDSAERTVRRRGWRRQAGNDGLVRVAVPLAWLEAGETNPPGNHPDSPPDKSRDADAVAVAVDAVQRAHRAEIDAKDDLIGSLTERVTSAETRADRAEAALSGERQRADVLRDRLDAAEVAQREAEGTAEQARRDATAAQEAAEALRRADAARRARGLLPRLRAALRGE